MKQIIFLFLVLLNVQVSGQVAINNAGLTAVSSAMLDVSSSSKGMLMPRMTSAQRKAIANPETGLLVFDTDRQTIYFFDGQKWKPMMTATEETAPLASKQPVGSSLHSQFGMAADIYDNYVVVGAPTDTANGVTGGSVYIFSKESGNWKQTARLTAPNPSELDRYGMAVSLHGDLLAVGAPYKDVNGIEDCGAVYVYKRVGNNWNYITMLTVSGGAADDHFGSAVTTSQTYIVGGAPERDHNGKASAGGAYIFGQVNGNWLQKSAVYPTDPTGLGNFGFSLDLFESKLAVGAPGAPAQYGNNPETKGGAVYVFTADPGGFLWQFNQKLIAGQTHEWMQFGYSVVLDYTAMYVGAPGYSSVPGSPGGDVGGAFKYVLQNGTWTQSTGYMDYNQEHEMGTSVAFTNGHLLIGMPGWDNSRGKVVLYGAPPSYLYDSDFNAAEKFGTVVAAHNGQYIITSPKSVPARIFFGVVQ